MTPKTLADIFKVAKGPPSPVVRRQVRRIVRTLARDVAADAFGNQAEREAARRDLRAARRFLARRAMGGA